MKLGDNGEAFFVEETEEEYVSLKGHSPWAHGVRLLEHVSEQLLSSFHAYVGDCYCPTNFHYMLN